ncbi:sensor histidine kinase [Algicola sagamiensis]|uniref:sensor histidine kinase n=1 Tax=Algicola sagamiensis TaxID=163869 RepID=UPI00035C49D1|nr:PAS domain-containing sensor histidine kinase [Algicola sagamiensis]
MKEPKHYLKEELYHKIQSDPATFEWLEQVSLDGIWYWDLENLEHQWLSPRLKATFGYEIDEIPHSPTWLQENIFPEDLQVAMDNFNGHQADSNHIYDQIVRYKHKNGSTVWIRCRGLIIRDGSGKPTRMLGAHTDVTSLKKTELELAKKQEELERSNQELEEFAFIASHDLKAPANAIRKIVDWLEEDCYEVLSPESKSHFSLLKKRSDRMLMLLEDLLMYSRVGRKHYDIEAVSLATTAKEIFYLLSDSQNFTLECMDANLEIQRTPFELVLRNLISNAIKHHHQASGKISITVELLEDAYEFYIQDDGPGIPESLHHKAMDIFQTLQPRDKVEGSGIGLAFVKKTVENYGGQVRIDSDSQHGTCMIITWPYNSENT